MDRIADELEAAFATGDLARLGPLLAEDARWGDDDASTVCRGRADVVETFARLLADGVTAEVTERVVGAHGVAIRLHVHWPDAAAGRGINFFQAYVVRDGLVTEIQRHDDRAAALAAIAG
jgi:hypothetical protein